MPKPPVGGFFFARSTGARATARDLEVQAMIEPKTLIMLIL
jgi:hypothetical protein